MVKSFIIEADTKREAFERARRTKRILSGTRPIKIVPLRARKTRREGIFEVTVRRDKRFG